MDIYKDKNGDMFSESFYGVTLSEKEPLAQFEVGDGEDVGIDQKLLIRQITLGAEAKHGEYNVVQVENRTNDKDSVKIPIAVLKAGETRFITPNIAFPSGSVTFKLIRGSGPVYINGQHVVSEYGGEEEEPDDFYGEDAPPLHTNGKNAPKRK